MDGILQRPVAVNGEQLRWLNRRTERRQSCIEDIFRRRFGYHVPDRCTGIPQPRDEAHRLGRF